MIPVLFDKTSTEKNSETNFDQVEFNNHKIDFTRL